MNELILTNGRAITQAAMDRVYPNRWRLFVVLFLVWLLVFSESTRDVAVSSMSDAFLAVTVFVAFTFAVVFLAERIFSFDLGLMLSRHSLLQPFIASLLGILPGCGGAIIVVTQYTRGYAGFGALIAVLVSTMGDAAFLLLAREPLTALYVFVIAGIAGTVTGMIVDWFHGYGYMSVEQDSSPPSDIITSSHRHDRRLNFLQYVWVTMILVGLFLGIMLAFLIDTDLFLFSRFPLLASYEPTKWFGFLGAIFCVLLWATVRGGHSLVGADTMPSDPIRLRIIFDTNFVTSWVIMAFLFYEIGVVFFGLSIESLFGGFLFLMPLIAILIGFIPGCGPQIVVTSLYLSGAIPFSALISNAIANDGDALFPALALTPRAAILATLYSAVPAFLIGYGFYIFG